MYIVAALLLALGAVVIVILMFIPSNAFDRNSENVWVPGSTPGFTGVAELAEFDNLGLRDLGPGQMMLVLEASNWRFVPAEIDIPMGTQLTIRVRSREEYHGF